MKSAMQACAPGLVESNSWTLRPRLGFPPSPVGYHHPATGGGSLREPAVLSPASFSRHDVLPRALRRVGVRTVVVYIAVCAAARRLGDVVGGALSDRTVWVAASFPHPSAQCHVVRGAAENAYGPRLPVLPDVHRSFWSCSVSHAHRARWDARPYGAVESPRGLASSDNTAAEKCVLVVFKLFGVAP